MRMIRRSGSLADQITRDSLEAAAPAL